MADDNFFYYIRDWLLDEPAFVQLLGYSPGDTYVPFFPAQQFPESQLPYVMYTTTSSMDPNTPWMYTGEAYMSIWFASIDDAQSAANVIVEMCGGSDASAGELERWLSLNGIRPPYKYHWITVPIIGEVETTSERGGGHAYAVHIRAGYSPKVQRDRYAYAIDARTP